MKNIYKTFLCLCFFSMVAAAGFAQTETVNVQADVQQAITTTLNSDVIFGTVQEGSTPILDPNGTNTDVTDATAAIGEIAVSASTNQSISISWNQTTVTLESDGGGAEQIFFDVDVDGDQDSDPTGATDLTTSSGSTATTAGSAVGGDVYWIFIGGTLYTTSGSPGSGITAGTVNGTYNSVTDLTVTVVYN